MEKKDDTLKHTHTHKTDRIRMRTSNSTLIVGKFNISISIMDRTINRKSIKKQKISATTINCLELKMCMNTSQSTLI